MGHSLNGMRQLSGGNSCHHHVADRQRMLQLQRLNARANLTLQLGEERFSEEATGGKVCRRKAAQHIQGTGRILDGSGCELHEGALGSQRLGSKPYHKGAGI